MFGIYAAPLVLQSFDVSTISVLASEGSGNSGHGGGGDNSGPGGGGNSGPGGGGDDGGNSGPGGGGDDGADDNGATGVSKSSAERDGVKRYLEALRRHGKVSTVQDAGSSISVTYADGWRETVNGDRYRLFDNRGRRVVDRAARRSDLARLRAAAP